MSRNLSTQHADLATALRLLGFSFEADVPPRNATELAQACRRLDTNHGGKRAADYATAARCAAILEKLAKRFRSVERHLWGAVR